ncbi:uncharacterized protein PG986_010749 [Apiospora aurea]|uniref:Aminoglycoside phosphotransferase domain-containing protein n=1 Tax=Apiospora aurea TaxID=335848 RepID=A0ABR1Q342_9PEZI
MAPPDSSPWDALKGWHNGTETLAINNTWMRRLLTRAAVRLTTLFLPTSRCRDGPCVYISKHLLIKTGPLVHLQEAATMKFVAENTPGVPLLKAHCAFVHEHHAYIVMERIQCESLPRAWRRLSSDPAALTKILEQLRRIMQELRSLKPPGDAGVQSCTGGSLYDARNNRAFPRMGPFQTVHAFHHEEEQDWEDIREMAALQDGPWPAPLFTHGDLNPSNIFVRGDEVVDIIGWETAGCYHIYWEYTSAWTVSINNEEWQGTIDQFLEPHPTTLKWTALGKDGGAKSDDASYT